MAMAESDGSPPPLKKKRLSLSLKTRRFASPTKPEALEKAAEGVIPDNTKHSTKWAVNTFLSWVSERNKRRPEEPIDPQILTVDDTTNLCFVLRLFVLEARKANGDSYPPSTIRNLLSGINRELTKNKIDVAILDKSDRRFQELHLTLDSISSELHRAGIGVNKESAKVITLEDEDKCWKEGTLGTSSPKILQHTVFFYLGLYFVLRGVQEQYDMLLSQLQRVPSDYAVYTKDVYYLYTEFISKNNMHKFTDPRSKNKVVRCYAKPGSDRCLVKLLDTYIQLLPADSTHLYMRPRPNFPLVPNEPAYCRQRVGINTIKKFVAEITTALGDDSGYTNHCLRATSVSRMYNAGIPEKMISEKSGHRSIEGLRAYERTSDELERMAERSIAGEPSGALCDEVKKVKKEPEEHFPHPNFSAMSNCTINITYNK